MLERGKTTFACNSHENIVPKYQGVAGWFLGKNQNGKYRRQQKNSFYSSPLNEATVPLGNIALEFLFVNFYLPCDLLNLCQRRIGECTLQALSLKEGSWLGIEPL